MIYVGTVLGGPLDGAVIAHERRIYDVVEQVGELGYSIDPTVEGPTFRNVEMRHRIDDDGRGWWVYPRHDCMSNA